MERWEEEPRKASVAAQVPNKRDIKIKQFLEMKNNIL